MIAVSVRWSCGCTRTDCAEIVVDPAVGFGYPVVKGAGARVTDVLDRFWAGEALRMIAYDFDLNDEVVEAIVRAQTKPPN